MIVDERPIGEIFEHNGVTLQVVIRPDELNPCSGCYFNKYGERYCNGGRDICITGSCSSVRKDEQSVIFKQVQQGL